MREDNLVKSEELKGFEDKGKRYIELAIERGFITRDEGFYLLANGVMIVPRGPAGAIPWFFTSETAARNYFRLFCKKAMYQIFLCHVTNTKIMKPMNKN